MYSYMKWGYLCIFNSAELVLESYVISIMRIYCLTGVSLFFLLDQFHSYTMMTYFLPHS